jgi:hypothetical protein
MRNRHFSDDRLIELSLDCIPGDAEQEHLDDCAACDTRRQATMDLIEDCTLAAQQDADAIFTDDRLERQRSRILHRIDHEGRPAKVISFPATPVTEISPLRARPATRWIAAAAAAGLVIGLLAGQVVGGVRAPRGVSPSLQSARQAVGAPATGVRQVLTTMSDEEFLFSVDNAVERAGGSALGPLDQMTPRVWEIPAQ